MSKTLPDYAREMDRLRLRMKPLQAELAALEAEFKLLKECAVEVMLEEGSEAYSTEYTSYSLRRSQFPIIEDDAAFFSHVAETHGWDLIRKQCNVGAAKERWDHGIEIPGVVPGTRVDLGIRSK